MDLECSAGIEPPRHSRIIKLKVRTFKDGRNLPKPTLQNVAGLLACFMKDEMCSNSSAATRTSHACGGPGRAIGP